MAVALRISPFSRAHADGSPEPIRIKIAKRTFTVELRDDPIMLDGSECDAVIRFASGEIHIASHLAPEDREHSLFHECWHFWERHYGTPTDTESRCDAVAAFTQHMLDQYLAQGGRERLGQ